MQEELNILIQAQYPLIYLVTAEEDRAEKEIATISQMKQCPSQIICVDVDSRDGRVRTSPYYPA